MMDIDCTFGASVTTCSSISSPTISPTAVSAPRSRVSTLVSKFESTDGARVDLRTSANNFSPLSSRSNSSSGSSVSPTEVTKGFYCKSAPAYGRVQSDQLNPAIVVEMFTNQVNLDEGFVDGACACITGAIRQHILSQRALNLSVHFLISTPNKVHTLRLACATVNNF